MNPSGLDPAATTLSPAWATAIAEQILSVLHRPYPNKIAHLLQLDTDVRPPRKITPAFWGAFDWHSSVHGHWSLLRLLNAYPAVVDTDNNWSARAKAALDRALDNEALGSELIYVETGSRGGFEMPYGVSWLIALDAEVAASNLPNREKWRSALSPLIKSTKRRFRAWLGRLTHPVRGGEHSQSMFAMGLVLDAARASGDDDLALYIATRAGELHGRDHDLPLHLEPSAFDFLSPCLSTCDLMTRRLDTQAFATWLDTACPTLGRSPTGATNPSQVMTPMTAVDPSDGKLVHFDGLNLSRAWMLRAIATALPNDDERRGPLLDAAYAHARRGLAAAITPHFAGSHWLGTFAVRWLVNGQALP